MVNGTSSGEFIDGISNNDWEANESYYSQDNDDLFALSFNEFMNGDFFANVTTGLALVPNSTNFNQREYMSLSLGPKRNRFPIVIGLTAIYTTIFFTGIMGNLFTFVVILKNFYMRTVTNYYLASLALSDLLALAFGK